MFAHAQLRGKTPEEVLGFDIGTRLRRNYAQCVQAEKVITYKECNVFERIQRWTLTTLSPQRDQQGRINRIIGMATEISDRKQLELALQTSESKLSDILTSVITAITSFHVFANRDCSYEYFSAGCKINPPTHRQT